jgi:hypothetical protein
MIIIIYTTFLVGEYSNLQTTELIGRHGGHLHTSIHACCLYFWILKRHCNLWVCHDLAATSSGVNPISTKHSFQTPRWGCFRAATSVSCSKSIAVSLPWCFRPYQNRIISGAICSLEPDLRASALQFCQFQSYNVTIDVIDGKKLQ